MRTLIAAVLLLFATTMRSPVQGGEWPQWRGPSGNGLSDEKNVPVTWSATENIVWKTPLSEPGNASPIVWGSKVFLTLASEKGQVRSLACFDRATGQEQWKQSVSFAGDEPTHGTNPPGSATPATDGERVIVWHSSAGLHCYDMTGKPLWSRDLGEFRHIWGYGSSPIIHGDTVLLNAGPGKRQFLIAINKHDGQTRWQVDEPGGDAGEAEEGAKATWTGSWSSPLVTKIDGQPQVVLSYPKHVQGYDLATGKTRWSIDGLGPLVYTDPLVGETMGVAMSGYHGPAIGFKLGGSGDLTPSNRLWQQSKANPQRIGSGAIVGRYVFMANENCTLQCLDLATGDEKWRERLGMGGRNWGSMLVAEGRLYITNSSAVTYVVAANPEKFELLATNSLNEPTNSTPAFSNGQAFIRTFRHLYCIGTK